MGDRQRPAGGANGEDGVPGGEGAAKKIARAGVAAGGGDVHVRSPPNAGSISLRRRLRGGIGPPLQPETIIMKEYLGPDIGGEALLQLPGIRPTALWREDGVTWIQGECWGCRIAQETGKPCESCTVHDVRPGRSFVDRPHRTPMRVRLRVARLTGCGGRQAVLPAALDPRFGTTVDATLGILLDAMDAPFAEVARRWGCDVGRVRRIWKAFAAAAVLPLTTLPERLGLDGVHMGKETYTMVTDLAFRRPAVVDLLPTHNEAALRETLATWPDRDKVTVIAIDPSNTLRALLREMFPNARIVADKRHVIKKAIDAADAVRIAVDTDEWARDGAEGNAYKLGKRLIETRRHDLTPKQRQRLDHGHPLLREAYWAKERFIAIYDTAHTRAEAAEAVAAWWDSLPTELLTPFRRLHKLASQTWRKEFLAHFGTRPRVTTAFVEAANRTLKQFARDARGRADHPRLRLQVLYRFNRLGADDVRAILATL